jgi:hypothetical protein
LIGVEKTHADDAGGFKHCADGAAWIAFLNALYEAAGYAGSLGQFSGGEFALNASLPDELTQ